MVAACAPVLTLFHVAPQSTDFQMPPFQTVAYRVPETVGCATTKTAPHSGPSPGWQFAQVGVFPGMGEMSSQVPSAARLSQAPTVCPPLPVVAEELPPELAPELDPA